jgi:hypothetical protein
MRALSICWLFVLTFAESSAREIIVPPVVDSLPNPTTLCVWIDGGVYPFGSSQHAGGFGPTSNIRLGVGRSFCNVQLHGFLEFTDYKFDPLDALSFSESSDKRYDIAAYVAGTFSGVIFLGGGIYYSHQDNIVTHFRDNNTSTQSGVQSHFRAYYLIGLVYQINLSTRVSLPIGLYFRDQDNPTNTFPGYQVSLRIGAIYKL